MPFWKNLFNTLGSSEEQLSENGVRALLAHLPQVHTEILQFFEPTTRVLLGQEVFIPNVLAEFRIRRLRSFMVRATGMHSCA